MYLGFFVRICFIAVFTYVSGQVLLMDIDIPATPEKAVRHASIDPKQC